MKKKIKDLDNKSELVIITLVVGLIYIIEAIIFLILGISGVILEGILGGVLFFIGGGVLFMCSFVLSHKDKRDFDERLINIRYRAITHGFWALLIVQINLLIIDMVLPDSMEEGIPLNIFLLCGVIAFILVFKISMLFQKKISWSNYEKKLLYKSG